MTGGGPAATSAVVFICAAIVLAAVAWRFVNRRSDQYTPAPPPLPSPAPITPDSPIPKGMPPSSFAAPPQAPPPRSGSRWAIYDEQSARRAANQGMSAAFFVAVATGVVAFLSGSGVSLLPGIGPTAWVDAVVFAILGLGIHRMRRLAAVGALLLYLIERIVMIRSTRIGIAMTVGMVAAFVQGIRGTYAFHRYRQQSPYTPYAAGLMPR